MSKIVGDYGGWLHLIAHELPNLSYHRNALKILSHLPSIYLCSLSFVYVLYSPWVSNRDVLLEKLLFGWRLPLDASDEDVLLSLFLSKKCSFTKCTANISVVIITIIHRVHIPIVIWLQSVLWMVVILITVHGLQFPLFEDLNFSDFSDCRFYCHRL